MTSSCPLKIRVVIKICPLNKQFHQNLQKILKLDKPIITENILQNIVPKNKYTISIRKKLTEFDSNIVIK